MDSLLIQNLTNVGLKFEIRKENELVSKGELESQGTLRYAPPGAAGFVPPNTGYVVDVFASQVSGSGAANTAPMAEARVNLGDVLTVVRQETGNLSLVVTRQSDGVGSPAPGGAVPCYVAGTLISTREGPVAVERLAVGSMIVAASGRLRPIRWIGSRAYPGLSAPLADRPVRIAAGALGEGRPRRDLLVSPDHALLVDGLLVAAGHLVNGTSITRGEVVRDLTYWHVELDAHDLLLAEGTPAESLLAMPGVRAGFDGVQASDANTAPVPCAPRIGLGPALAALRRRLILRAGASAGPARSGPMRAWLDRCALRPDGALHVAGWVQDTAQPDSAVCLDIVVDGAIVAMTIAAEYRADIAAAGVGDGRHGFDLGVTVSLAPGVPHLVEVRRAADEAVICAMAADAAGRWTPLLAA